MRPTHPSFPSIDVIDQTIHKQLHANKHSTMQYDNELVTHNAHYSRGSTHSSTSTQLQPHHHPDISGTTNDLSVLARGLKELLHQHSDRQQHVNQMNNQLMAYNFMLHYVQSSKTQKLQDDYAIMKQNIDTGALMLNQLNTELVQQQYQITQLESTVSNIELDVEKQHEQYNELNDELLQQKSTLEHAMEDYDARIAAHELMLQQQSTQLERLLNIRLRVDFGIDVLIVCVALYLSKIGALPAIIKVIAHLTVPSTNNNDMKYRLDRKRRLYAFISIIRILVFTFIVKRLRTLAQQNGLHNNLGNSMKYTYLAKSGISYIMSNTARLIAGDQAEKHVRNVSNWWLGIGEQQQQSTQKQMESADNNHIIIC